MKIQLDENRSSFFQTTDIGLITTLLIQGVYVDHTDSSNPKRVVFFFEQSDKLADNLKKYWEGSLLVEPKTYWNTLREVKGRIRNDWSL